VVLFPEKGLFFQEEGGHFLISKDPHRLLPHLHFDLSVAVVKRPDDVLLTVEAATEMVFNLEEVPLEERLFQGNFQRGHLVEVTGPLSLLLDLLLGEGDKVGEVRWGVTMTPIWRRRGVVQV